MMLPQSLHAHFISEVSSITPFDQKLTGGRRKAATIATTGGLAHWTASRNALRCTRLSESPACVTAEELRQKRVRSSAKDRPSMGGGSVLPHQAAAAFASAATNESRGASSRLVDGDGVVIVDHGSRRAQSNAMLRKLLSSLPFFLLYCSSRVGNSRKRGIEILSRFAKLAECDLSCFRASELATPLVKF